MNRSKNKFRHYWIDEGSGKRGEGNPGEIYIYNCRHCGAERFKRDAYSFSYRRAGSDVELSRAPECERKQ